MSTVTAGPFVSPRSLPLMNPMHPSLDVINSAGNELIARQNISVSHTLRHELPLFSSMAASRRHPLLPAYKLIATGSFSSSRNCFPRRKDFLPARASAAGGSLLPLSPRRTQARLRPLLYQVSGHRQIYFRPRRPLQRKSTVCG